MLSEKKNENNQQELSFPKCINCETEYLHKQNLFGLCMQCLNSELYNQIMAYYLVYINEILNAYEDISDEQILNLYKQSK
jgi:hypothetical protein